MANIEEYIQIFQLQYQIEFIVLVCLSVFYEG